MDPGPAHTRSDTWLLLASRELASRLEALAPEARIDVVPTGPAFHDAVTALRPRLAVIAAPPADQGLIEQIGAGLASASDFGVVLINGLEAVEQRLWALRVGFADALSITTSPLEIVGRLRLLASRLGPAASATRLSVGDGLELDLAAHRLLRDGRTVALRPKEFALLALLASHPGRAFTRRELEQRLWGGHPLASRSVDVHVRWLRMKVEPEPARPRHLVTVRGVGYRLDAGPTRNA